MMHSKRWILPLGLLVCIIASPRIANAAVTATLSSASKNPYYGSCPVNMAFNGSISGTAGTKVTYSWNRFINGAQQVMSGGTVTLTAAAYNVSDSITVTSPTSGNTFDQLWVHNISTGQSDVYSNKVDFTATCLIPLPSGIKFGVAPPTPTGLTNTTDPPTCTAHAGIGGGVACLAGINSGMLALIWAWTPNAFVKGVDGYKVYRVDGNQHSLQYTQNNGTDVTLVLLPKPSDGFNGKCYVVTAYTKSGESSDSQYFCAGNYQGGPIVESFTLVPNATRTVYHHYSFSGGGPGCGLPTYGTKQDEGLWVGFIHRYDSSAGFTCDEFTSVDQTALGFNLGTPGTILRGSKAVVKSAQLTFKETSGGGSCIAAVHLPNGDWSNAQDLIPNGDYISGLPWSSNNVEADLGATKIFNQSYSIDVSTAINNWSKGIWSNNGFLLMGGNEDTSGFHDNNQCYVQVGNFVLSIQVQINP